MVNNRSVAAALTLSVIFFSISKSDAQFPSPEIYSISPPVIEAGKSTEISLIGVNLEDLTGLTFSAPGFTAKPVLLPATEFRPAPTQNGQKFIVTAPDSSTKKTVEIRAAGFFGLSTSRPLVISSKGNQLVTDSAGAAHHQLDTAPELTREALAHGVTDANQIDWWKFSVKKGERLLIHCEAERIESQADISLKVVDGRGYELEAARDSIGRDPMIDFTAPMDGNYWIGLHDIFFKGGANFSYLLKASSAPWIDAVIPPAGKPGTTYKATLIGRNLPGGSPGENYQLEGKPLETLSVQITVPAKEDAPEFSNADPASASLPGFTYRFKNSNPVRLGFADHPVVVTEEHIAQAPLTVPTEIAARFDHPGDSDHFEFAAKKGGSYWIEVIGDRIGDLSDPFLMVEKVTKDKDGKESLKVIKEGDDLANAGGNTFNNGSRDVSIYFVADEAANYRVTVINQFKSGTPTNIYRLQIREAKPDFEVLAILERPYIDAKQAYPAAPLLRKGGTFPVRLLINRKDRFTGPITVQATGLPDGVTCPPLTVQNLESPAYLTFAATDKAPQWSGNIHVTASATIGEKVVKHEVRAGSVVLGNNDYSVARIKSRLSTAFPLAVSKEEIAPVRIEVENAGKFSVTRDTKLAIPFKLASKHELKGTLTVTPIGLRGLIKPPVVTVKEDQNEGTVNIDFTPNPKLFNSSVGTWNFVLKGTGVTKYKHNPGAAEKAKTELTHVETLAKKYTGEATQAKKLVEDKKKSLATATKNLTTATADSKAVVEKSVALAKTELADAEKQFSTTESKRAQAEKERTAALARSTALTKSAAQKDVKFSAWSLPLTVEVLPEKEKK